MGSNEVMKPIKYLLPVVLLLASVASADKLIVPKQYKTIQSAVDAAVQGDQIIILPGTYPEKVVLPSQGISLIGKGGPEATTIDATGLSGSPISCIIGLKDPGKYLDDSVSGLTLTGGTGTLNPVWNTLQGGGMFIYNASPTIHDCIITGNTAEFGGGGIWAQDSQSVITSTIFTNNTVTGETRGGGGLYLWNSSATVTNCSIRNNQSDSGGGLNCKGGDTSTITGCDISMNNTNDSGGGISVTSSSPVFEGCTIKQNAAMRFGGGATVDFCDTVIFRNCTFEGNAASFTGGGLRVHEGGTLVEKCHFEINTSEIGGGGIVVNGNESPGVLTVSGCSFVNNAGSFNGGAIHHTYIASSDIDSSTICGSTGGSGEPITGDWNDLGGNSLSASCTFFCGGDIDANGLVNVEDILLLLSEWGQCDGVSSCFSDQNEDSTVDVNDLLMLIANWGTCG